MKNITKIDNNTPRKEEWVHVRKERTKRSNNYKTDIPKQNNQCEILSDLDEEREDTIPSLLICTRTKQQKKSKNMHALDNDRERLNQIVNEHAEKDSKCVKK